VTDEAQGHGGTRDIDPIDAAMMARCIELSRIGAAAGELPIGSLITRRGQIIAESTNEIMRLTDESRHAEIIAIARARNLIGDDALSECTLYSTVEPCPMCAFCIRTAGLGRVAFALGSPIVGGLSRWNILGDDRRFLFGPVPELLPGLLADEAHRVWIELRPITGRAIWVAGFLTKPKMKAPGSASPRSRYRFRRAGLFPYSRGNTSRGPRLIPCPTAPGKHSGMKLTQGPPWQSQGNFQGHWTSGG
jgi:tRNA(adenine34) deaminase